MRGAEDCAGAAASAAYGDFEYVRKGMVEAPCLPGDDEGCLCQAKGLLPLLAWEDACLGPVMTWWGFCPGCSLPGMRCQHESAQQPGMLDVGEKGDQQCREPSALLLRRCQSQGPSSHFLAQSTA